MITWISIKRGLRRGGMAAAWVWLSVGGLPAQTWRVAGSDMLGAGVPEVLTQWASDRDETLALDFRGSFPAGERLRAGEIDYAVLMRGPGDEAWPTDWRVLPVGYLVAIVVADARLRLDQLDYGQLATIYGEESTVASVRWGDFGERGERSGWQVRPFLTAVTDGMAHELFVHTVLRAPRLRATVIGRPDAVATLRALGEVEGGIAVVPRFPEGTPGAKALLIAAETGRVAFGPTPENIHAGDYPLRLELALVFREADTARLRDALRVWYGDAMAAAMERGGVVALPRAARERQDLALEMSR